MDTDSQWSFCRWSESECSIVVSTVNICNQEECKVMETNRTNKTTCCASWRVKMRVPQIFCLKDVKF